MPLRISFWHYSLPLTNSPVSLLVNLFFFSSLFSLSGWDIFIRSVGFLSLSRTRICLPASPSLCSCQLFWHLCVANKPNWKYLCINKWGRGAVWKRRETDQSCDTSRRQYFRLSICLSIYLSATPPLCCIMVRSCDRKWTSCADERGFRPRGGGHTGASVLCVCRWLAPSVHLSPRPQRDVCPATRVVQNTRTHIQMKTERSAPSSNRTNGHSVTLREALQDHSHRLAQWRRGTLLLRLRQRTKQTKSKASVFLWFYLD